MNSFSERCTSAYKVGSAGRYFAELLVEGVLVVEC